MLDTRRAFSLCFLSLLAMSCAGGTRYFTPAEEPLVVSIAGFPSAQYDILERSHVGTVEVWSEGAETGSGGATRLHLALKVANAIDSPLELDLDQTRLESVELANTTAGDLRPAYLVRVPDVEGHTTRRFNLWFELPEGSAPDDVRSFRARWLVRGPDRRVHQQSAQFVRHAGFRPVEKDLTLSRSGFAAAEYPLAGGVRDQLDERETLRVWSAGPVIGEEGERSAVLRVGFELRGERAEALEVDLQNTVVRSMGVEDYVANPTSVTDRRRRGVRLVEVEFPLPEALAPSELETFHVRWRVRGGGAARQGYTAFLRDPYFRPVSRPDAQTERGQIAEFELLGTPRWGEVRVWSAGAETVGDGDAERAVVSIGFEIENATHAPLELDVEQTMLAADTGSGEAVVAGPALPSTDTWAEANSVGQVGLLFSLPDGVLPGHLRSFRVRWILRGAGGEVYVQHTSFRRRPPTRWVYHYPWYYEPGWVYYCYR